MKTLTDLKQIVQVISEVSLYNQQKTKGFYGFLKATAPDTLVAEVDGEEFIFQQLNDDGHAVLETNDIGTNTLIVDIDNITKWKQASFRPAMSSLKRVKSDALKVKMYAVIVESDKRVNEAYSMPNFDFNKLNGSPINRLGEQIGSVVAARANGRIVELDICVYPEFSISALPSVLGSIVLDEYENAGIYVGVGKEAASDLSSSDWHRFMGNHFPMLSDIVRKFHREQLKSYLSKEVVGLSDLEEYLDEFGTDDHVVVQTASGKHYEGKITPAPLNGDYTLKGPNVHNMQFTMEDKGGKTEAFSLGEIAFIAKRTFTSN